MRTTNEQISSILEKWNTGSMTTLNTIDENVLQLCMTEIFHVLSQNTDKDIKTHSPLIHLWSTAVNRPQTKPIYKFNVSSAKVQVVESFYEIDIHLMYPSIYSYLNRVKGFQVTRKNYMFVYNYLTTIYYKWSKVNNTKEANTMIRIIFNSLYGLLSSPRFNLRVLEDQNEWFNNEINYIREIMLNNANFECIAAMVDIYYLKAVDDTSGNSIIETMQLLSERYGFEYDIVHKTNEIPDWSKCKQFDSLIKGLHIIAKQ